MLDSADYMLPFHYHQSARWVLMAPQLQIGDITVDVVQKDIKNVYLSVHPPTGRVRISAPKRMKMETIRVFAVSKQDWIKRQQKKIQDQEREIPREYVEGESHYVWGKLYLLTISERDEPPSIELKHSHIHMRMRPGADVQRRQALLEAWCREQIKTAVPTLLAQWEPKLRVKVERFYVRRMKTKWGSCNYTARTIRLNTELAKKPRECLEYMVIHELVHMLEPSHDGRFVALMDKFMPEWKFYREELNRLPVRHADWKY